MRVYTTQSSLTIRERPGWQRTWWAGLGTAAGPAGAPGPLLPPRGGASGWVRDVVPRPRGRMLQVPATRIPMTSQQGDDLALRLRACGPHRSCIDMATAVCAGRVPSGRDAPRLPASQHRWGSPSALVGLGTQGPWAVGRATGPVSRAGPQQCRRRGGRGHLAGG